MNVKIEESWRKRLQEEFDKPYFRQLTDFVRSEYAHEHVLPHGSQIFHMFNVCPFEKVKVVILGQDPYPTPGQYYGVCFSVPEGTAIPASLMNIFKEMIKFQRIICIEVIDDSKSVPFYTMLIEQLDSFHHFLERRLSASGPAIFIMKFLRPVSGYTNQEIVLFEKFTPLIGK